MYVQMNVKTVTFYFPCKGLVDKALGQRKQSCELSSCELSLDESLKSQLNCERSGIGQHCLICIL